MTMPVIYGARYSVYTRIVRMMLHLKNINYTIEIIDIFDDKNVSESYMERHPFGKIPSFSHDGFNLYETGAICRYIDEEFPDPPLFPTNTKDRARVNQVISILDNYAYPSWVWGIYVERMEPEGHSDEAKISGALVAGKTCFQALDQLMGSGPSLVGSCTTLADLYAAAMMDYLVKTPEGQKLLDQYPKIASWWGTNAKNEWVTATAPTEQSTEFVS